MDYALLKQAIIEMHLGERKTIYEIDKNISIFVNKPLTVPTKLKNSKRYDPRLNFQIGLSKKGQDEFLPNHLRILIDLYLKRLENKDNAEKLFDMIEDIYEGADPLKYKDVLNAFKFTLEIENAFTILCLAQLFMLEQDINYGFGKVQPPRAYLMGYIRMIRLGAEEFDKLLWSSTRHPPRTDFRNKDCLKQCTLG
jgi:hypothetical protein